MTDLQRQIDKFDMETKEDLELDSIRETGPDIHQVLVQIDEEMGKIDFDTLKFLCRDEMSGAKLEAASSPLDIFESLQKLVVIDVNNFDFLLECLGRIHRFDLVRKLGFEPGSVKEFLPEIKRINSFRVLLMDIADDLDEKEFSKMKFLLSGKIKKRKQKDMETVLELFVFMEQEGLLACNRTQDLKEMLNDINRPDLKNLLDEFLGIRQDTRRREPIFTPSHNRLRQQNGHQDNQLQSLHIVSASGANIIQRRNLHPVSDQVTLPRRTPADAVTTTVPPIAINNRPPLARAPPIDRSASAGTISVPSDSSFTEENTEIAEIPQALFLQIVNDLKDQFSNVGIELGFSNDDIDTYIRRYTDSAERTKELLNTWKNGRLDKGQVIPGLKHVLVRLGCKSAADALQKWTNQLSNSTGQRSNVLDDRVELESAAVQRNGIHHDINYTSSTGEARPAVSEFQTQDPPVNNLQQIPLVVQSAGNQTVPEEIAANQLIDQLQRVLHVSGQHLPPEQTPNELFRVLPNGQLANQVPVMPVMPVQPLPGQLLSGQPLPGQVQALTQVQGQQQAGEPSIDATSFTLPEYKMNSNPRGWCVIINNRDFYVSQGDNESKEMPSRTGTDKDAESLQYVFDKLGFIVRRRDNLTDTEIMTYLVDIAHNVNHEDFDCFVCCILTHGVLSHLYGSNGRLISIKDITATFQTNRCPMLAGKPKLFFLQACQGRDKMSGGEIERDMAITTEVDGDKEFIPNEADFLLGYATVPGYVSFRSRNHGSWYIRKLCELLEKHSQRHDLMSILVEVNREVSHANAHVDGGIFKQTPAPLVTLRKKLFFR